MKLHTGGKIHICEPFKKVQPEDVVALACHIFTPDQLPRAPPLHFGMIERGRTWAPGRVLQPSGLSPRPGVVNCSPPPSLHEHHELLKTCLDTPKLVSRRPRTHELLKT